MSTTSACNTISCVRSVSSLLSLLDRFGKFSAASSLLFVAVKGASPSRADDSICILLLHIVPQNETHLIDVESLGKATFSTKGDRGVSLKAILELPRIRKVAFNVLQISNALFKPFQISIDGFEDLQLMELATREASQESSRSLEECVEQESTIPSSAKVERRVIEKYGDQQFNSEKFGCQLFNGWELDSAVIEYCQQQVVVLPVLYNAYCNRLRQSTPLSWQTHIRKVTVDRVKQSQSAAVEGCAEIKNIGGDNQETDQVTRSQLDNTEMHATEATPGDQEDDQWVAVPKSQHAYDPDGDGEGEEDDEDDWYDETAQEWTSWEEDMVMNGEKFI